MSFQQWLSERWINLTPTFCKSDSKIPINLLFTYLNSLSFNGAKFFSITSFTSYIWRGSSLSSSKWMVTTLTSIPSCTSYPINWEYSWEWDAIISKCDSVKAVINSVSSIRTIDGQIKLFLVCVSLSSIGQSLSTLGDNVCTEHFTWSRPKLWENLIIYFIWPLNQKGTRTSRPKI